MIRVEGFFVKPSGEIIRPFTGPQERVAAVLPLLREKHTGAVWVEGPTNGDLAGSHFDMSTQPPTLKTRAAAPALDTLKRLAVDSIKKEAECLRQQVITPGYGKALTYREKLQEARNYKAASNPVDTDFVMLNAEATATGQTVLALADLIIAMNNNWVTTAAAIEAEEQRLTKAIRAATDHAGINAAKASATWPSIGTV